MPTEKFRFKKFEITQDELVHKVGTDGVLLGAWVELEDSVDMLDVGTGTGLIAIMLAQRSSVKPNIVALEANEHSKYLAEVNVNESQCKDSISIVHSRIQDYNSSNQFDLIVCNPPFFINSLKPPSQERLKQRHSDDLTYDELLIAVTKLLHKSGRLAVVLPTNEGKLFESLAHSYGLNTTRCCCVFSKANKPQERFLFEFSYLEKPTINSSIVIMNSDNSWTEQYMNLTKDFYLNF